MDRKLNLLDNLPGYFTRVTVFSKVITGILLISLPFLGFSMGMTYQYNLDKQILDSNKLVNVTTVNPKTINSTPTLTPINEDMYYFVDKDKKVELTPYLSTSMIVPKGAYYKLKGEGFGIEINLTSNIVIKMCGACQGSSVSYKCDPKNYLSEEGSCSESKINIGGQSLSLQLYKDNPNKMAFIDGVIDSLYLSIVTNNEEKLTANEQIIVSDFIKGIVRVKN